MVHAKNERYWHDWTALSGYAIDMGGKVIGDRKIIFPVILSPEFVENEGRDEVFYSEPATVPDRAAIIRLSGSSGATIEVPIQRDMH